jgi:hypothetical protein
MNMPPALPLLVLLPWAALGCENPAARQDASTARDSAGVRIVENLRGTWTTPWQIGAEPLLSIGSVDGDPDHLLYRVIGAVGLPGGQIVVANEGSLELLFYDKDGNLLHCLAARHPLKQSSRLGPRT